MIPLRLTNLLGDVIGTKEVAYNPSKRSLDAPIPKETFYRWEAQLAQCAYLSRLVYSPSEIFLRGIAFLEYAPDVMNDIITQLERSFLFRFNFQDLFVSQAPANATTPHGRFFPRTGCAIFQHHNPTSKINSARTLYVVFKGSSSLRDFMNDSKLVKTPFTDIPELAGLSGTTHGGFYKHMRDEVARIIAAVEEFSAGMERVVITGHSLGGAMSTLFSLMLALKKRNGAQLPPLHCVTFGAPNLFSDDARNAYNSFLLDGTLTLDRVTAESKGITGTLFKTFAGPSAIDIVIMIPGTFFSHPGFNILKTEMYATSRTGRAKDIDDIRAVFLGPDAVVKRKGAGPHELPADPVFWNLFTPLETDAALTLNSRLQSYGKMNRMKNPQFIQFVLKDLPVSSVDIQPTLTDSEKAGLEKAESEEMKADIDELAAAASQASAAEEASEQPAQAGGAFTFATSSSAANYKKQTLEQFPSRINYQCYKSIAGIMCHAGYMGIGFLGALRIPKLVSRDETGKLAFKPMRKVEPTLITNFMGVGDVLNPAQRYFAVPVQQGGHKRRHKSRKQVRSNARKSRRQRKNIRH